MCRKAASPRSSSPSTIPSQDEEAKRLADRLIDQIRGGANFGAVAQQFSQSPTAAVGGDIGWVTAEPAGAGAGQRHRQDEAGRDVLPDPHRGGYYLLYLLERRKLGSPIPATRVLSLVQVVFRVPPTATAEEQTRVANEAQQISDSAKSCGELAKIGRERAPQVSREVAEIKASELPAQVRQVALGLGVAEASKPMAIPGGIGVIMVCERKEAPGGLPTRDEIAEQLGARSGSTPWRAAICATCAVAPIVDVRG